MRTKQNTHPIDVAVRRLEVARAAKHRRELERQRQAHDAAIAAQIPDLPW